MAKFEIVPGLTFADRRAWGPNPAHPRLGNKVDRDARNHIIIHHTDMIDTSGNTPNLWDSEAEAFAMMRQLQTVRPDLGFDVPYNFIVFLMSDPGKVMICEGRGEDRSGAHTKGHNTRGIGVCFAGGFESSPISNPDLASRVPLVSKFLGWLKFSASHPDYGNFPPMTNLDDLHPHSRAVFFHQDFRNTDCPGQKLKPHAAQLKCINPA